MNSTVLDVVGNVVTDLYNGSVMPRPANFFTADDTLPFLVSFDFDLDTGRLHLTFSEVVDEINAPSFTVLNDALPTNTTQRVTLNGAKSIYGPSLLPEGPGHPPVVTISVTDNDLNEIKRQDHLAVSNATTFIAVTDTGAVDPFNNTLNSDLLQVTEWTDDSTWPQLAEFSFSANTGVLGLTFDETVRFATFNATTITFVNNETSTIYTVRHHPPSRGASVTEYDSTVITLTLANDDLNEIKILSDLAVSRMTTYIALETYTVADMRGNPLNVSNLPQIVAVYEDDITRPELTGFDLDLDNGLLTLYFSETVNVSTLDIEEITLQPTVEETTPALSYTLAIVGPQPEGSFSNSTDGPVIQVYIGDDDLNEVKRIPELATLSNNTYISISAAAVRDMVDLPLVPVETHSGTRVRPDGYTPDTTDPELISFNFDLDLGQLELTFDETVDAETLDQTKITLQSRILDDESLQHFQIMKGEIVSLDDPVLVYNLSFNDLNNVKLRRSLAISPNSTFINLAERAILDMAYNANPSVLTIMRVANFTDDLTRPQLLNFVMDINSGQVILNFDEPVDHRTLQIPQITFQSSANQSNDPSLYFTLETSNSSSGSGLEIIVDLSVEDLNEIKLREGLLINPGTTFISVTEDLIHDMRGNALVSISPMAGQPVREYIPDDTRPHLLEFHLDMDASTLHLTFLEAMNASSINFTSFVLQVDSYVVDDQLQYRLTEGVLASYNDSTVITIIISLGDLNAIKALQIGTSTSSSWLVIDSAAITDQNRLSIRPLMNGVNAQQASQYTIDTSHPELQMFAYDLDSGELTLHFSETVRVSSLNSTTVTFLNAASEATNSYTLQELGLASVVDSALLVSDGPSVVLQLTDFDQNELKRWPDLATDVGTTFLSVRSSTVYDMQVCAH